MPSGMPRLSTHAHSPQSSPNRLVKPLPAPLCKYLTWSPAKPVVKFPPANLPLPGMVWGSSCATPTTPRWSVRRLHGTSGPSRFRRFYYYFSVQCESSSARRPQLLGPDGVRYLWTGALRDSGLLLQRLRSEVGSRRPRPVAFVIGRGCTRVLVNLPETAPRRATMSPALAFVP